LSIVRKGDKEVQKKFREAVDKLIGEIEVNELEKIDSAAGILADTVINGGILYTFGTGHSMSIAMEAVGKRGSLINAKMLDEHIYNLARFERLEGLGPIILQQHQLTEKDCVIVASNSGRNPLTIEIAKEARKQGAKVISISAHSVKDQLPTLESNGKYLSDYAHVAIDNHGDSTDLLVEVPNTKLKVGSPSTLTGIYIYYLILTEAVDKMINKNFQPPLIKG